MDKDLRIFKALSDNTRLKIVKFLLDGEKCVCQIYPQLKRSQPTISLQLKKLEALGILKSRRENKYIFYSIANPQVKKILSVVGKKNG